jgi:ABC-2 type transport system permease protein
MLSQAVESITRAFYSRGDVELILASPAPARRVFSLRLAAIAAAATALALTLYGPFINVMAFLAGPRWLAAYLAVAGLAACATAVAATLADTLFRTLGAARTRIAAQIVAAIVGAIFVIGIQAIAILYFGAFSRLEFLISPDFVVILPASDSLVWVPVRAVMGEPGPLAVMLAVCFTMLALAIAAFSGRFAAIAVAASGVGERRGKAATRRRNFTVRSPFAALVGKEWRLLLRDPWLLSQSLMQVLYLVPPALFLWVSYGKGTDGLVLVVPVLVMAAGQLGGGLAWLAVSGEDAPDLVATAPVDPGLLRAAKIVAVLAGTLIAFSPMALALVVFSAPIAATAIGFILIAAGSATGIQWWFRTQAKRSHFRRRQTSSRIATFAEALSSIGWAATAGLAAAGSGAAFIPAALAALLLVGTRALAPAPQAGFAL